MRKHARVSNWITQLRCQIGDKYYPTYGNLEGNSGNNFVHTGAGDGDNNAPFLYYMNRSYNKFNTLDTESWINIANFALNKESNHLTKGQALYSFSFDSIDSTLDISGSNTFKRPFVINFT